ncbi:MAG: ABC transporter ATP-binding protein [Pseudomonadota bacterium]
MFDLYAAIWRVSARRQVLLVLLSLAIAALSAVPLSYQKDIINALTAADISHRELVILCLGMFAVVLLSLSLKWAMGLGANTLGEDVIRRLRRRIYSNALDENRHEALGAGSVTTMISAEAEDLGKFAGSAFSEPVMQVGTMVAVVGYIATAQPVLGVISLCIVLPQVVLVLSTQRVVNRYVAERVQILRAATRDIVEDSAHRESEDIRASFDRIYDTRWHMFVWKLSTKFLLSAINGAGTVGVLLLGGWFVLKGQTDVGTVVAATMGLARLQGPTSFMIAFYRQISATQVKYELLRDVALLPPNRPSRQTDRP